MQIVSVLWLVKRYLIYRGATRLEKSLENYSCLSAASYKVSIAQRGLHSAVLFSRLSNHVYYTAGSARGQDEASPVF